MSVFLNHKLKDKRKMNNSRKRNLLIGGYYDRFDQTARSFFSDKKNIENANECVKLLESARENNSTIYIIGNGGSAAVAEHTAIDLTKNAGVKALAVSGSPMLTTFSNDYGYKDVFKKFIELFANKEDVLIAISSSGSSENIINACREAKKKGLKVVTLSGFEENNPLRKLGDIDFWVKSRAFGYLETLHGLILHWMVDSMIGSEIYMIK